MSDTKGQPSSQERNDGEYFEVFSSYLKKNNLKMTRQRHLIVSTFLEVNGHLSADELYEQVRQRDSGIGFTTVFRTLKALTECGLARETDLNDGRTRFERRYRRPKHHHIVCQECHKTIEFFSPELEELQASIASEYGLKPVQQRLQIQGICKDCQEKKASSKKVYDNEKVFARDALRIAMATEKRGVRFYQAAAEVAGSSSTRKAFLAMLEEEEKHLSHLEIEWKRLLKDAPGIVEAPVFLHFDFDALEDIFPSDAKVKEGLLGELSETEALEVALKMEKDAYAFFSEYAERFEDTRGRDIFLRFAGEEQDHCEMIQAELDRLSVDTGSG